MIRDKALIEKRGLSPRQLRTFIAIYEALIPQGGPFRLGGADVDISFQLKRFFATAPVEVKLVYKIALFVIEFLPFIFIFRFRRFTKLSKELQTKLLHKFYDSKSYLLRNFFRLVNLFCQEYFYSDPRANEAVGYLNYKDVQPVAQKRKVA